MKLRWWDLPHDELREIIKQIGPDNIKEFIKIVQDKKFENKIIMLYNRSYTTFNGVKKGFY